METTILWLIIVTAAQGRKRRKSTQSQVAEGPCKVSVQAYTQFYHTHFTEFTQHINLSELNKQVPRDKYLTSYADLDTGNCSGLSIQSSKI